MDVFDEMFGSFTSSAHRVETLPIYKMEGGEWEEFRDYQSGKILTDFANQDWVNQISIWTRGGKQISRVRVLPTKLNDYLRYELEWCYPKNSTAGEQFRFVSERTYQKLTEPKLRGDFWMFDNKFVLLMFYNSDGSYKGEELLRDRHALAYVEIFNHLHKIAKPFDHVLRQIRTSQISLNLP